MQWGNFQEFKELVREWVELSLRDAVSSNACNTNAGLGYKTSLACTKVQDVAWYAVHGGHRWRAMVTIAAGRIFHEDAFFKCLPPSAAVELAHAASLILDDLPSMDDGKIRRGLPCAHLRFSDAQWAVDMAPVYMVNVAYLTALQNSRTGYRERVESALEMSRTSHAMIAGQELDVTQDLARELETDDGMLKCYEAKSGALYASAAKVGAITCSASKDESERFYDAGMLIGMAYQFMDDVCDVVGSIAMSGKNPGQDAGKKRTAVDFFGVEGARGKAFEFQEHAIDQLAQYGKAADTLRDIARNASWALS